MQDFLTALGLMMIFEGAPYFITPQRMRQWMARMKEIPDGALRGVGLLMMLVGLATVYLVRAGAGTP